MALFVELIAESNSSVALQEFIINNIDRFRVLNNGDYEQIFAEKNDIKEFIESKYLYLRNIDYDQTQCKAFISILFDFCERFGFICITCIESILLQKNLSLGCRREAAKLFLIQVRQNNDYKDRFEQICSLLQCSIETEEENEVKPVVTFLNYLAKVIRDTFEEVINSVRAKVSEHTENNTFPFLQNHFIQEACTIPVDNRDVAYASVQEVIERCLGHVQVIEPVVQEVAEEIIIERDTEYSIELLEGIISFDRIRSIAVDRCANRTTYLQGRGVIPLRSESEMFIYLKRYGNMHKSKLLSAFEAFPFNELNEPIEVIDWGCGQGLASLVLIDYLRTNNIPVVISKIILIEPSELVLRRAALHISSARNDISLSTICKFINNLSYEDIHTEEQSIKIHLFSNVLDIDEAIFSMEDLTRNITSTQLGRNYFFCISPYINDEKADRVDSFKRYFQNGYESFQSIFEASNSGRLDDEYWNCNNNYNGNMGVYCNHPECGCYNKWTRVIILFRCVL